MKNKNWISRTMRRCFFIALMGGWFAFPACASFNEDVYNDEMDQSAEPHMVKSLNIYGKVPDEKYVIIQGSNSIVISAKIDEVTDEFRVYVLWEEGLTVGDVLTRGGEGDGRFYHLNLIRDGEQIRRGAGWFERHKARTGPEWELLPGDVIELNQEMM